MARLPIGQKAQKTGKLLFGLNNPRVAALLQPYGYGEHVHKEGWGYLTVVSRHRLATFQAPPQDPKELHELDEFENHWFPITKAILDRKFPQASNELFGNLHRTDGQPVAISVAIFVARLDAMDSGDEPFSAEGAEARNYLRSRGLTDDVITSVKRKLEAVQDFRRAPLPKLVYDRTELVQAEEAMWKWYLEWSTIARTVIKDGNLLRSLGFRKRKGRFSQNDDEPVEVHEVMQLSTGEVPALPAE